MDENDDQELNLSDEEEFITAQKVLETLENAWLNEKFSPEILPHKSDMLDLMLGQVSHIEENLKQLDKNDFRFITHKMELERIRYIIASYLRCRLEKIETYTSHILHEEESRPDDEKRLSENEAKFAQEYFDSVEKHFFQIAVRHMPSSIHADDKRQRMVQPNLMSHVFLKANVSVASVVVGNDEEEVDIAAGSQHMMPYMLASDLVLNGSVQLI